jgi:pimeloyl-ACP methyl ester carboxylesterase
MNLSPAFRAANRDPWLARAKKIHCETAGVGKPVILLHGLSGSSRWWKKNIIYLAGRFNLHLVDINGFGQSNKGSFSLQDAAQVIVKWMDHKGIEQASLIGHSMGGYITLDLAANYPGRVERIVLVDALALPMQRSWFGNAAGMLQAIRYTAPDFLPVFAGDAWRAGPRTLFSATRSVMAADLRSKLAKVQQPTLIVWGENDTLLPLEMGRKLHRALPQAEFCLIEGAGHNPMWDRPRTFNRIVTWFLQGRACLH